MFADGRGTPERAAELRRAKRDRVAAGIGQGGLDEYGARVAEASGVSCGLTRRAVRRERAAEGGGEKKSL